MIKNIDITHYRKLKNLQLPFNQGVNLISGTNGTCKSSILHIIGNTFQGFKRTTTGVNSEALNIIRTINKYTNPKVENLTKGDKTYNDPAKGTEGALFKIQLDNEIYAFRRHNSKEEKDAEVFKNRFRLILNYARGQKQSLPFGMVIYLGLSRIVPIGELSDVVTKVKKNLPEAYQKELVSLYEELTNIQITQPIIENNNNIKHRLNFNSNIDGIDSNTISAGEDNIMIMLTALVSLKYHFESCSNPAYKMSYLLIDEIDATLHPSLQFKLLKKINEYSKKYNIQVFSTTHSLYLLEAAFKEDINVTYLKKGAANSITLMTDPDIYKVRMNLNTETSQNLYENKKIPIFTEDNEARELTKLIFEHFTEKDSDFASVFSKFHFSTMSAGADNLKSMFKDEELTSTTLKAICILDGDKPSEDLSHHIISLPGGDNPEQIAFKHLKYLLDNEDGNRFWNNNYISNYGFTYEWALDNLSCIAKNLIRDTFEKLPPDSTRKPLREQQKEFFNGKLPNGNQSNDIALFFKFILKDWIIQNWEDNSFKKFRKNLQILFHKVADFHNINPDNWPVKRPVN